MPCPFHPDPNQSPSQIRPIRLIRPIRPIKAQRQLNARFLCQCRSRQAEFALDSLSVLDSGSHYLLNPDLFYNNFKFQSFEVA